MFHSLKNNLKLKYLFKFNYYYYGENNMTNYVGFATSASENKYCCYEKYSNLFCNLLISSRTAVGI